MDGHSTSHRKPPAECPHLLGPVILAAVDRQRKPHDEGPGTEFPGQIDDPCDRWTLPGPSPERGDRGRQRTGGVAHRDSDPAEAVVEGQYAACQLPSPPFRFSVVTRMTPFSPSLPYSRTAWLPGMMSMCRIVSETTASSDPWILTPST